MSMIDYELELYKKGKEFIGGVDEVGRGPLAGPMVTAAVILHKEHILNLKELLNTTFEKDELYSNYSQINDSKKISHKKRLMLDKFIRETAVAYSIQLIETGVIDAKGIAAATQMGFYNAVKSLSVRVDHILTDSFRINAVSEHIQTNIIRGDTASISIAAASIIAKVFRDDLMEKMHLIHPQYGFDKHKGYGTKYHLEMLEKHGPCEIHRKSFEPIKSYTRNK